MKIIERIDTYAKHGGAWDYLKAELISDGMSMDFAQHFISVFRKNLGPINAKNAATIYDKWLETKDENQAKLLMLLLK